MVSDTKDRLREDIATVKAYTNAAMETDGMTCAVFVAINQVCAALSDVLNAATPPADAALAVECDSAAMGLRQHNPDLADTLNKAAAALRARAVPDGMTSDRYNSVITFALRKFMHDALMHRGESAKRPQLGTTFGYAPGATDKFDRDAKDAEAILAMLAASKEAV